MPFWSYSHLFSIALMHNSWYTKIYSHFQSVLLNKGARPSGQIGEFQRKLYNMAAKWFHTRSKYHNKAPETAHGNRNDESRFGVGNL